MRLRLTSILLLAAVLRLHHWKSARDRAWDLCARQAGPSKTVSSLVITGSALMFGESGWEIGSPRLTDLSGGEIGFAGEVVLHGEPGRTPPLFGRAVRVSGPFRCVVPRRNPGRMADGLLALKPPRLRGTFEKVRLEVVGEAESPLARLPQAVDEGLLARFRPAPGFLAFLRAVWLGDTTGLPPRLLTFYRESGLLAVLALSGQHVAILSSLLNLSLGLSLGPRFFGRSLRRLVPVLSALFLCLASSACPSMQRALAMTSALFVLRWRRMESSFLQVTGSAVAFALVLDPSLVCRPGFLLSAATTAMLAHRALGGGHGGIRDYLLLSAAMPVLAIPLTAFLFAKVAWLSPVLNIALGWLWALVLIPLGFILPLLFLALPRGWEASLLPWLEGAWEKGVAWHLVGERWVGAMYGTFFRPTWGELLLWEAVLLGALAGLWRRESRMNPA